MIFDLGPVRFLSYHSSVRYSQPPKNYDFYKLNRIRYSLYFFGSPNLTALKSNSALITRYYHYKSCPILSVYPMVSTFCIFQLNVTKLEGLLRLGRELT